MIEEKYNKTPMSYYVGLLFRKLTGVLYTYPEFMFLAKIILLFAGFLILFLVFKSFLV